MIDDTTPPPQPYGYGPTTPPTQPYDALTSYGSHYGFEVPVLRRQGYSDDTIRSLRRIASTGPTSW